MMDSVLLSNTDCNWADEIADHLCRTDFDAPCTTQFAAACFFAFLFSFCNPPPPAMHFSGKPTEISVNEASGRVLTCKITLVLESAFVQY